MRTNLKRWLFSIGSLCGLAGSVFANMDLPKQSLVPGGVAIINLDVVSAKAPEVRYLGNRTCVLQDTKQPNRWFTVVGIPLTAAVGVNHIEIATEKGKISKTFLIKSKKYPTEHLKIPEKRKVEPHPEDLAQIEREYLETIDTYAFWADTPLKSLRLAIPVVGRKSSPFGFQRIMNNVPKNPHSGLDFAAPMGSKVGCAKDGVVINIGNYFYSGNIVFVDHGQGFITSYCHLNSVNVTIGQKLHQGELVGTVGKTGRATGPHLHWSVSLNGVRVDPQLFITG